jgi:hypothetical protein
MQDSVGVIDTLQKIFITKNGYSGEYAHDNCTIDILSIIYKN